MWIIELLAYALPFWRASEDAGLRNYFDNTAAALYLEGWTMRSTNR